MHYIFYFCKRMQVLNRCNLSLDRVTKWRHMLCIYSVLLDIFHCMYDKILKICIKKISPKLVHCWIVLPSSQAHMICLPKYSSIGSCEKSWLKMYCTPFPKKYWVASTNAFTENDKTEITWFSEGINSLDRFTMKFEHNLRLWNSLKLKIAGQPVLAGIISFRLA